MSMPGVVSAPQVARGERGQFLPGASPNPGGRPSETALLFRALTRELARRRIPDDRARAEKLAELLVERTQEELETPLVHYEDEKGRIHGVQQQYTATKLLFSKMIPDRVAVKMYESDDDSGRPSIPVIDMRVLSNEDRLALVAIAQRVALAKDSALEPSGETHGKAEVEESDRG